MQTLLEVVVAEVLTALAAPLIRQLIAWLLRDALNPATVPAA
jgi:hypothetical protein